MPSSRAHGRPQKGREYHELLDALDERGCPVCRRAEESVEDAISAILHEQVNDAAFREQFLASGGFCTASCAEGCAARRSAEAPRAKAKPRLVILRDCADQSPRPPSSVARAMGMGRLDAGGLGARRSG